VHIKAGESLAKINVPETAGDYLVVYRTAKDEKVLVSKEIKVLEATGWVKVSEPATAGKFFELEWGGPENQGDRLAIFDANGKRHHSGPANKSSADKARKGRTTKLIAPDVPGNYVVKLLTAEKRELGRATLVVK